MDSPALVAHAASATLLTAQGELCALSLPEARAHAKDIVVCHAPATAARLSLKAIPGALDVLELFAFARPAHRCVPSPLGLARALDLPEPVEVEDGPIILLHAARALIAQAAGDPRAVWMAAAMGDRWPWAAHILAAAGAQAAPDPRPFAVWEGLAEWEVPPPVSEGCAVRPLTEREAQEALAAILPGDAEDRGGQRAYAGFVAGVFATPRADGAPHLLLAEGATGTGKTLAYLAPAAAWAARAGEPVWVSTYTKNLQRQISGALMALWPDPTERGRHAATRKGRENTLCLLSLEELAASPRHAVQAGIMARWVAATADGDLSGAGFPGWLPSLLGFAGTLGLADRRGECIYAACPHYKKCFIERSARAAEGARIVVANHALTLARAALAAPGDALPRRYIFDEGHHLFDAADGAFATRVTGREMADLRRWLLGPEGAGGPKSRRRGLARRAEGLVEGDEAADRALKEALRAARALPGAGWGEHLKAPRGPGEAFLAACLAQVEAAGPHHGGDFAREAPAHPSSPALAGASGALAEALSAIEKPLMRLAASLLAGLRQAGAEVDADTRSRTEALARALAFRVEHCLAPWRAALADLAGAGPDEAFCDLLAAEPGPGADLGLERHWVDPMRPFARAIVPHADGIALTSATLRDGRGPGAWGMAALRAGTAHLAPGHARSAAFPSPFDYAACARAFVVTDVDRADPGAVAAAYRALFEASGGGALGLFTAISRLRATHARIAAPLEAAGIPLYAQHVDEMDVGTLLDLFRAEEDACLLGTDAVRDGVDVPGRALRLLVMDRVPWPRPGLLHKARRAAFGARAWDDAATRLRLTQAFGRLIRRAGDRGVFVLLDPRLPSRLEDALPEGVEVRRTGLGEVTEDIRRFLMRPPAQGGV